MNLTIGFSVDLDHLSDPGTEKILNQMLDAGCTAVQVHAHPDLLKATPMHLDIIKQFGYRTVHLPELHDPTSSRELILASQDLGTRIDVQDFTLHPTNLDSFGWLAGEFGDLLSIENMDRRKDFGKTPADLARVFSELPNAGWIFDVNHIKTNDPTMALADEFYKQLSGQLKHYHLSGYVDDNLPHTLLADTRQDEIIAKVTDKTKPIILESLGANDLGRFREELAYVSTRLQW